MKVGPVTIVANCEIYNYRDLKEKYNFDFKSNCDTEIIGHLYLKFGIEKTVKMLDGVFAFVIHDSVIFNIFIFFYFSIFYSRKFIKNYKILKFLIF